MIWCVALILCFGLVRAETPFDYGVHNDRVVGGSDAHPGVWKWQVSLQIDSYNTGSYYHFCGGTLVDARHVITAAHCILSTDPNQYRAVVGEYILDRNEGSEQILRVQSIIVHPGWNGMLALGNDIAIMRLADFPHGSDYVEIANLPYPGEVLPNHFECFITGWGLIDFAGTAPSILQEAPIRVVEHSVCSQPDWWGTAALETMVCAGGDGVISGCQGDSGGPLNCFTGNAWRVHGVVSYGPAGMCNQWRKPTVFTRVSAFQEWIQSVILS